VPTLLFDDLEVVIVYKPGGTLRLTVHPPQGRIRLSAPQFASETLIREFLSNKIPWIRRQQTRIRAAHAQSSTPRFRGKEIKIVVEPNPRPLPAKFRDSALRVYVRPGSKEDGVTRAIELFYRTYLGAEVPRLIERYEPRMGVEVKEFRIKKMKTRWGTCNHRVGRIWINLEMAKKSPEELEYLVVHEMVHLLEPSHNQRFKALMDQFYPKWRTVRKNLNSLSVGEI